MIEIRLPAMARLQFTRSGSVDEVAEAMTEFADTVAAIEPDRSLAAEGPAPLPPYATYGHEIGWRAGGFISTVDPEPTHVSELSQRIHQAAHELRVRGGQRRRVPHRARMGGYVWVPSRPPNRR